MKYKIRDNQFELRYFAEGETYETLEDCTEQLRDYHSVEQDKWERPLSEYSIVELCDIFEWRIEQIPDKCQNCGTKYKSDDLNYCSICPDCREEYGVKELSAEEMESIIKQETDIK